MRVFFNTASLKCCFKAQRNLTSKISVLQTVASVTELESISQVKGNSPIDIRTRYLAWGVGAKGTFSCNCFGIQDCNLGVLGFRRIVGERTFRLLTQGST